MHRTEIQQLLLSALTEKRAYFQTLIDGIVTEMAGNAKSSAGDKHETSMSMAQNEQEKIGNQLLELEKQIEIVKRISVENQSKKIGIGSVIKTCENTFYLSIGFGKITYSNQLVFCISPNAPLGQLFLGKAVNDEVVFNQQVHKISAIY
ncbi:MAG: 3-oxoacyl-ACP synthase [Crocinitomicaceae bacterium]|nr:3-oxoacyl-ACP synthase [Crocinitomicaceae bacterium]